MSALSLALLLTTAAATAVGAATLRAAHGLRKQITALRTELAEATTAQPVVPAPRVGADADEIRSAVAEALADEREREMAEARAFWAAQEARDASSDASLLGPAPDDPCMPRQGDLVGLFGFDPLEPPTDPDEFPGDSPELAAARRRHPSHPDFVPAQSSRAAQAPFPAGGSDHEAIVACLEGLAHARTALADVRPGPLGTLDVYVFVDGTTLCMTPGNRETAEVLAEALRSGDTPFLLGGSSVSGSYALTFSCGAENIYILADRVIASH
ncbi:hypothetical protein [Streptomyces odontomachi]|uniref:hypothetical protein n=1 Tax=Streptomyces odontomachi TaxID=2944940 RepID=UPI00210BEE4B|nr:hypothetical protein [Streptomyces sp. ODS25]